MASAKATASTRRGPHPAELGVLCAEDLREGHWIGGSKVAEIAGSDLVFLLDVVIIFYLVFISLKRIWMLFWFLSFVVRKVSDM